MLTQKNNMLIRYTSEESLQAYIKQVHSIPILSEKEEEELAERWWKYEDIAAAQKLVLAHLRLVVKIAQSFRSYELPMPDVISEGNIGLMKAVRKFNTKMGCRLATYASWWIRAAIQEYILKSWSMLKVSTSIMKRKLFCKLCNTQEKITSLISGKKSDNTSDKGEELLSNLRIISLHQPTSHNDEDAILMDKITNDDHISPEDKLISRQEDDMKATLLQNGIAKLSDREKDILYNRRLKTKPTTLESLSIKYGVSQERIRQIEGRVIEKLRNFTMAGIATIN
jgi:RNA polymerase sigma-32 factor